MTKPVVIVTRKWPEQVEARLKQHYDVKLNTDDHPMTIAELQQAMREADAVLPTVTDAISAEVININ